MPASPLAVVGASAGGVEVLTRPLSLLPVDLPAAILVVMHAAPAAPGVLPRILARAGTLPVEEAMHGIPIEAGRVYVAPGDQHLIVVEDSLALVRGPRVAGVVLSGNLSDGTQGLAQVGQHGGRTLVQEPTEALFDGMPRLALAEVRVDAVLPLAGLAATIERFARAASPAFAVGGVEAGDARGTGCRRPTWTRSSRARRARSGSTASAASMPARRPTRRSAARSRAGAWRCCRSSRRR